MLRRPAGRGGLPASAALDPDARVIKMLGARGSHAAAESDAKDTRQ